MITGMSGGMLTSIKNCPCNQHHVISTLKFRRYCATAQPGTGHARVPTPQGAFLVPYVYIACHGHELDAGELPKIARRYGFRQVP